MSSPDRRRALALIACAPLGACGFSPASIESGGAGSYRGQFEIQVEGGREGFVLEDSLLDRLGESAGSPPYRLIVRLELESFETAAPGATGVGRRALDGTAKFEVIDRADGSVLLSDKVSSWTSWKETRRTAATLAARRDAEDRVLEQLAYRIVERITVFGESWKR